MSNIANVYKPLDWQVQPWNDKVQTLLLTGSAGGGKSRVASEKVNAFMLKYPGATGLMLRKAREYASKSIVPFMRHTVIGQSGGVVYKKGDNTFEYANGSMLYVGGMRDESQREGVRSIGPEGGLDIVWIEEATQFTEQDYNEILARMRGTAAGWTQIILTTNPGAPSHWIKKRLIDGGEASVYYSRAQDNPHNPPAYLGTLDKLTGVLRLRLRDGKWVQAEGAVYPMFDYSMHVLDNFEIPQHWRRFRSIDFGYTNPFVCQWWALDEDDRMYLYREIYMTKRTVRAHAEQINRLSAGEVYEFTVSDHDAEDRATLEESGIYTVAATKDITVGIQEVSERLQPAGDGRPRLFVLRNALVELDETLEMTKKPTCTLEEFDSYTWPPSRDGASLKELPVKDNDHGMDGTRYACMSQRMKETLLF
jgi:PBSX family phage terminase large subunit